MKTAVVIAHRMRHLFQVTSIGLVAAAAAVALLATLGAALGLLPWLSVAASFGEAPVEGAGSALQLGITGLLLALCFFVPSSLRVLRLETSHRRFAVGMEDIARAYYTAHADDRRGAFRMRSEFDAVRERLAHLRQHPDLGHLEPEVLEIAAQMSVQSRHLAETYAEDKVSRARRFLEQRQEEVERAREAIARAHHASRELKRWSGDLEAEEGAISDRRERLEAELRELLPELGLDRAEPETPPPANVVRIAAGAD